MEHQKTVSHMIKEDDGSAGVLHKIAVPMAWRGGQVLQKEEKDPKPSARCEETRQERAKHWQCGREVQHHEMRS